MNSGTTNEPSWSPWYSLSGASRNQDIPRAPGLYRIRAERQTSSEEEQLDFGYYPELPSRNRPKWGSPDVGRFGFPIGR